MLIYNKMENTDNNYYVPSIEEFRIGFEFEYLGNEWRKKVLDLGIKLEGLNSILKNSIRVKKLDQQDIESLGFKLTQEENKSYSNFCCFKNNELELSVQLNNKYFPRLVSIKSTAGNHEVGNFRIRVKNKSELQQVLKMVGVN